MRDGSRQWCIAIKFRRWLFDSSAFDIGDVSLIEEWGQPMNDPERELLKALASMSDQYLACKDGSLDHMSMAAGERAVRLLVRYGLLEAGPRGGTWTEAGRTLLRSQV